MSKPKKRKGFLIGCIAVCCVLAALAAAVFGGELLGKPQNEMELFQIETPYGSLQYPAIWRDAVQIRSREEQGYVVSFYTKTDDGAELPLFDFHFGDGVGYVLGNIAAGDGRSVPVSFYMYAFEPDASWEQDAADRIFAMRDDVNVIIEHLDLIQADVSEEEEGLIPVDTVPQTIYQARIETPYIRLQIDSEWADHLQFEVTEGEPWGVAVYAQLDEQNRQLLFDLSFAMAGTGNLGQIKTKDGELIGVGVDICDYEPDSTWSDEQVEMVRQLQECVNDLIAQLSLIPVEEEIETEPTAPQTTELESTEDLVIETPYAALRYPGCWQGMVRTEMSEEDDCSVSFYGRPGSSSEYLMFTVHFSYNGSLEVGTTADQVPVSLDIVDLTNVSDLSAHEKQILLAMQEDLNYLLQYLGS